MTQRLCAVLGVLALAACGSDSPPTGAALCTKAGNVSSAITTKLAACAPDEGAVIPTGSACTTALASCSTADQGILNNLLDCLNNALPGSPLTASQCTSTFPTLVTQLNTCSDTSHVSNLSSQCKTATGLDSSSSSTLGNGSCTYTAPSNGGGVCVQLAGQDMTSSICSLFNQQGLTFAYSSSGCASTVGGQGKLGTCTLTSTGVTAKMAIYGTDAATAQSQCTTQGGTWAAGA